MYEFLYHAPDYIEVIVGMILGTFDFINFIIFLKDKTQKHRIKYVVVLTVAIFLCIIVQLFKVNLVKVPQVTGDTYANAVQTLHNSEVNFIIDKEINTIYDEWIVTKQSIDDGIIINKKKQTVILTVEKIGNASTEDIPTDPKETEKITLPSETGVLEQPEIITTPDYINSKETTINISTIEETTTTVFEEMINYNYSLSKTSYELTKGYGFTLSVTGADSESVKWFSSDTSIATVSNTGKVLGRNAGNVTIYAIVNGAKLSCAIKVVDGKLSLSTNSISMEKGDVKYITVRAKGSHDLNAVVTNNDIVTASWVEPWNDNAVRLKLTSINCGLTTVRIQFTHYTDVYATISVIVKGDQDNVQILADQPSITTEVNESTSLIIYTNKTNSLSYSLSDNSVATVTNGIWDNYYCTLTINGIKTGTTNLIITRTDMPNIKKVIPIIITESSYELPKWYNGWSSINDDR